MTKVFRVFISETSQLHHDIEAASAYEAKCKTRAGLNGIPSFEPIEDRDGYTGYQIDDAVEIAREDSDLA